MKCVGLQVIKGAEILEVLHSLPSVRQYLFSLYECRYSVFFQSLGEEALFICTHIKWKTKCSLTLKYISILNLPVLLTGTMCPPVLSSATAMVEQEMKKDWLFAPHYRYYVREMRIQAYSQLLESYRSLTLGYMAEAFGVSTEFIDQWVHVYYFHVPHPLESFSEFISNSSWGLVPLSVMMLEWTYILPSHKIKLYICTKDYLGN